MKLGNIAYNIYVTAVLSATFLGLLYLAGASVVTKVQDKQHNFGGAITVEGVEAVYKGRKQYNPLLPLPWQDRNGYAEVILNGNKRAFLRYEDLTAPFLEYRIIVIGSKDKESEFNEKSKYDEETRKEIDKLKEFLGRVDSGRSISDIVEEEIQEAIAKR